MFGSVQSKESRKSTISSFHSKYNVPEMSKDNRKTNHSSGSNTDSEDDDFTYKIDFHDDDAYNNTDLGYLKTNNHKNQDFFDSLSTISKIRLQKYDDSKNMSQKEVTQMRIFKGDPILEFMECINVTNFDHPFSRQAINNNYAHFVHENIFVFNNMNNVVSLTLDTDSLNYLFKPMYTPRTDEFVSFINVGRGVFKNIVFVGEMAKRSISFFDVQENIKLFEVQIEETEEVMLNAVNLDESLFVSFMDGTIQQIQVRIGLFENLTF